MRQLEEMSLRDPELEYFLLSSEPGAVLVPSPQSEPARLLQGCSGGPPPATFPLGPALPASTQPFTGARRASTLGEPAPAPAPAQAAPSPASALTAARAPARLVSALCQKALNSNGCRYRLPYTKRPAGR